MQFAGPLDDHAAEIIVAGDLFALPVARHHIGAGLRCGIELGQPSRLRREMVSCPGADKAAGLFPKAGDVFLFDQPVDQREGVGGVRQHPVGAAGLDIGGPAAEALADIDAAADRAAIARAGAKAELVGLRARPPRCRAWPVRARSTTRHIRRRRSRRVPRAGPRRARRRYGLVGLPPIGRGREIPVEDVGNHRPLPIFAGANRASPVAAGGRLRLSLTISMIRPRPEELKIDAKPSRHPDKRPSRSGVTSISELEERILARDQEGGSRVYYELLRRGRPLPEIMA